MPKVGRKYCRVQAMLRVAITGKHKCEQMVGNANSFCSYHKTVGIHKNIFPCTEENVIKSFPPIFRIKSILEGYKATNESSRSPAPYKKRKGRILLLCTCTTSRVDWISKENKLGEHILFLPSFVWKKHLNRAVCAFYNVWHMCI